MAECKTIGELKSIIREEVLKEIRARLDESLSRQLYHFCPLAGAVNILKDGRFHLSSYERHKTEKDLAAVISSRTKAMYPYSKVVDTVADLPSVESDNAIYKVKAAGEGTPANACFRFRGGKWQYIPGSESNSAHITTLRKDAATSTELPDGRISYGKGDGRTKGEYYMCFSRTPGAFDGYSARMQDRKWRGAYVRFSVNGDILNYKYKGGPVNYYTSADRLPEYLRNAPLNVAQKGKPFLEKKPMTTTQDYGKEFADTIDRTRAYEHEDRLFSNDQFIPSKTVTNKNGETVRNSENLFSSGIVERIDIFVLKSILEGDDSESETIIGEIMYIINKCKQYGFLKKLHIYNTEKGLSVLPMQTIYDNASPYMKKKYAALFSEYMEMNKKDILLSKKNNGRIKMNLKESDAQLIADVLGYLVFGHVKNEEAYTRCVMKLIRTYGFLPFANEILSKMKPFDFYVNEIKNESWWNFNERLILASINNLQGWKIPKIADRLRKMIFDYLKANGLPKVGSMVKFKAQRWKAIKRILGDIDFR